MKKRIEHNSTLESLDAHLAVNTVHQFHNVGKSGNLWYLLIPLTMWALAFALVFLEYIEEGSLTMIMLLLGGLLVCIILVLLFKKNPRRITVELDKITLESSHLDINPILIPWSELKEIYWEISTVNPKYILFFETENGLFRMPFDQLNEAFDQVKEILFLYRQQNTAANK